MNCLFGFLALFLYSGEDPESSLESRIETALSNFAADRLPVDAIIDVAQMTPVRGYAEDISILKFNPRSGYFSALLSSGSIEKQITGRADTLIGVVVPVRFIRSGEEIGPRDLAVEAVRMGKVPSDFVRGTRNIVGMVPSKALVAGRPISRSDLSAPDAVQRNDRVTIYYIKSHMRLSAAGTALSSGAPGTKIDVLPQNGSQLIQATVIGPGQVRVGGEVVK